MTTLLLALAGGSHVLAGGTVTDCSEQELRTLLAGGGTVTFASDCTITLSSSIAITAATGTIIDANGHQVTISGGGQVPLFWVSTPRLTLKGLRLANAKDTLYGGSALNIAAGASVDAYDCIFTGNSVVAPRGTDGAPGADAAGRAGDGQPGMAGTGAYGGAILNQGTLQLTSCTLSNNSATAGNGGNGGAGGAGTGTLGRGGDGGTGGSGGVSYGGAIFNSGVLTMIDCTVVGNSAVAGNGGTGGTGGSGPFPGRAAEGGAGSNGCGGGIYNSSSATIEKTTFSGNSTRGGNSNAATTSSNGRGNPGMKGGDALGGGFYNAWWGVLNNNTFYYNICRGGAGGNGGNGDGTLPTAGRGGDGGNGVGGGAANSGTLSLLNCTLSSCGAYGGTNGIAGSGTFGGGNGTPGGAFGGNLATVGGSCTLQNSLVVWEQVGGCGYGTFTDGGYNMTSDNTIPLVNHGYPNTWNPGIGTFGMYGGANATVPLLAGSPAIDKIPLDLSTPKDQRGVPRVNGLADIGAFEASPPLILVEPRDQTNIQGAPVTFSISAAGIPPLRYQWLFQGNRIANATASSYTVTGASVTNLGPYQATVSDGLGTNRSRQAWIHLAPSITVQPTNQVALAGADVSFSAGVAGEPPLLCQWHLNVTNLVAGGTNPVLTLRNVQVSDIGSYSLAVTNGAGHALSAAATLNLRPTILTPPSDLTCSPGQQAVFRVSAAGTPPLTYQWRFEGAPITGATLDAYTNVSVQVSNAGRYQVTVMNSLSSTTSPNAVLTVVLGINGTIREGTNGVPGVSVAIGPNLLVITGPDGAYDASVPPGSYLLRPSLTNYAFSPVDPTTNPPTVIVPPSANRVDFHAYPLIRIARPPGQPAQICGGGITGLVYQVEASTNLGQWQPVFTNSAPIQFTDPESTTLPTRYYRFRR
jgi:hypothetical protein